jgi:hypothetical protein
MPRVSGFLAGLAAAAVAFHSGPAQAVVRLPPLNDYPDRCELAFTGNTIGQANAVSDKLLDLRQCKLHGAVRKEQSLRCLTHPRESSTFLLSFADTSMPESPPPPED